MNNLSLASVNALQMSLNNEKSSKGMFSTLGKQDEILNMLKHVCWKFHGKTNTRSLEAFQVFDIVLNKGKIRAQYIKNYRHF